MFRKIPGIFLLAGLVIGKLSYAQEFEIKRLDDATLKFQGRIGEASSMALLKALKPDDKVLIINSPGGDANYAAAIGSYLHEHQLAIVVENLCASACANYVFLAAPKKTLLAGSLLGFHGSLLSHKTEQQMTEIRQRLLPDQTRVGQVRFDHPDDMLKMFSDNERLELMILDKADLTTALFKHVDTVLEKLWQNLDPAKRQSGEFSYYLKTPEGERRFGKGEEGQWIQAAEEIMSKQGTVNMGFVNGGRFANLMYFPGKTVLEQHGVKGIASYAYPATEAEFKQLPAYKHYEKTNVWVGDFPP